MEYRVKMKGLAVTLIALVVSGCGAMAQPAPAVLPTVVLGAEQPAASTAAPVSPGGVTASGVVTAAAHAQVVATLAERVKAVNVGEGDEVRAGDVLLVLDDDAAQAQLAQAQAALQGAQADHDLLAAGPSAEQLRGAEAAVIAATANYSRTIGGSRAADVAAAQAAYDAANAALLKVQAGALPEDVASAQAALQGAEAAVKQAQARYDDAFRRDPAGISASPAALALEQATLAHTAAQAAYDKAVKPADAAQLAAATQQVESARAALDRARAPARAYDVVQAQAQIDAAQAQLDALRAGARAQQLDVAQARIAAAQAQVRTAEAQLKKLSLTAPITGVVTRVGVRAGEGVAPGQVLLALADLRRLQVETTDLSELDVVNVELGEPVMVTFKALGQSARGQVIAIAPEAEALGGDVVYRTTIALDEVPPGLRAGMSADVAFNRIDP